MNSVKKLNPNQSLYLTLALVAFMFIFQTQEGNDFLTTLQVLCLGIIIAIQYKSKSLSRLILNFISVAYFVLIGLLVSGI